MHYECKTILVGKMQSGPKGPLEPLCNKCQCKDCSNPIEWRKISIIGVVYDFRVLIRGDEPSFVLECKGFIL